MMEVVTNITTFFALVAVSSVCIGLTAFIWTVMYKEWKDRR